MSDNPTNPTPGPWEWRDFGGELHLVSCTKHVPIVLATEYAGLHRGMVTRDGRGVLVRITPDHPNARLIAAAPDLLKACLDVVRECYGADNIRLLAAAVGGVVPDAIHQRCDRMDAALNKARAAISKATEVQS